MKNGFSIDVKTEDNVTIGLDISAQYHVDYSLGNNPMESGIFKSYYMLQEPVEQMKDFITDALRSAFRRIRSMRYSLRKTTSLKT